MGTMAQKCYEQWNLQENHVAMQKKVHSSAWKQKKYSFIEGNILYK